MSKIFVRVILLFCLLVLAKGSFSMGSVNLVVGAFFKLYLFAGILFLITTLILSVALKYVFTLITGRIVVSVGPTFLGAFILGGFIFYLAKMHLEGLVFGTLLDLIALCGVIVGGLIGFYLTRIKNQ